MTSYILYVGVMLLLIISAIADINRTKKAIKIGYRTFKNLLPTLIPMMILIGILLTVINAETISLVLGKQSGVIGVFMASIVGSIAFLPSFVAFPLGASLLSHGAGYPQIAAFVSSLMSVGIASLSMEMKYFGTKSAVMRNAIGFIGALSFAWIIGRVM